MTTEEFDDFSYCRHSATVATPYRRGSSARHGEKYNNQLAMVAMDGAMATRRQRQWTARQRRDGDYDATATGRRRRTAVAGGSAGAKTKMTTTEAAVEAMAIAGGVDTLAAMTATTARIVPATTMTRLNVYDASTEEKERPSNLSRMHATIK